MQTFTICGALCDLWSTSASLSHLVLTTAPQGGHCRYLLSTKYARGTVLGLWGQLCHLTLVPIKIYPSVVE